MQFITALFGETGGAVLNAVFALGIVLALIVLGLWLLKQFNRAGTTLGQGRRRLAIVESAVVDGKRRVLIVRRDNVEHLILTGGAQDLVIESGIAAPEPVAMPRRGRAAPHAEAPPPREPSSPADIATPPAADHPVTREAVDRLGDLARPAPLPPRPALRHTALLRPVGSDTVIPMTGERRGENPAGSKPDSDRTGPVEGASGHSGFGDRNRSIRSVTPGDRT